MKKPSDKVADVGAQVIIWAATLAAIASFLYVAVYGTYATGVIGFPGGLFVAVFMFTAVAGVGLAILWVVTSLVSLFEHP